MSEVKSGQTVSGSYVGPGTTQRVDFGGRAIATVVEGGTQTVYGETTYTRLRIASGGPNSQSARQIVHSGGEATGTAVGIRSEQSVLAGATARKTTVNAQGRQDIDGGTATSTHLAGRFGLHSILVALQTVENGGVASGSIVAGAGEQDIGGGGNASATTVLGGGLQQLFVHAGGHGKAVAHETVVSNGGKEIVSAGGQAFHTMLKGGEQDVRSGGAAIGTVIDGGFEFVAAGGVIGGRTVFGKNGELQIEAAASLKLTFQGFSATDTLNLAGYAFSAAEKFSFVQNADHTGGILTITDGALQATTTLFGQYVAAGFQLAAAPGGGTDITYAKPAIAELAAAHSETGH